MADSDIPIEELSSNYLDNLFLNARLLKNNGKHEATILYKFTAEEAIEKLAVSVDGSNEQRCSLMILKECLEEVCVELMRPAHQRRAVFYNGENLPFCILRHKTCLEDLERYDKKDFRFDSLQFRQALC